MLSDKEFTVKLVKLQAGETNKSTKMKSPTSISQEFDKSNKAIFTVIRSRKIVWKQGPYCWYFCSDLKDLRWPYREYFKTGKNGGFCVELFSENDFENNNFLLLWLIFRDQKDYRKYCSCVTVCRRAKMYHSLTIKMLVTYSLGHLWCS